MRKNTHGGARNFSGSRPQYKNEGAMKGWTIMLTPEQRSYVEEQGGVKWLRKLIDNFRGVTTPIAVRALRKQRMIRGE